MKTPEPQTLKQRLIEVGHRAYDDEMIDALDTVQTATKLIDDLVETVIDRDRRIRQLESQVASLLASSEVSE